MNQFTERELELYNRIQELEAEIKRLKNPQFDAQSTTFNAFAEMDEVIDFAEKTVGEYFSTMKFEPSKGRIEIAGQRYILLRASSLSVDFFNTILSLYEDHGDSEAFRIGQSFLFDIAHVIGMEDAVNFHEKMKLKSFFEKLSAGLVHFAYSGWAYVEILNDSNPIPGDDFYLHFNHPYSFEADSWLKSDKISEKPVCIMNSGYSSGWCETSAGQALTTVEITCRACGDEACSFIMAPPQKIDEYLKKFETKSQRVKNYDIPSFFIRKEVEEKIRKAKEKAEASDRAKSEFLANISHELRTPLNTIIGYSEMLKMYLSDNKASEYLSFIDLSSRHLIRIVDDLLDLSKIEAGQLLIEVDKIKITEFFYQLGNDAKILSEEKWENLNFEFKVTDKCPDVIYTDKIRLQQVFYNLLSNAIKFTEKGSIKIVCDKQDDNNLIFSVIDSGIGIDKDRFDEIFEIFRQGDGTFSRKFGGSGLGLSICKKLVELLGGKIWLKSDLARGTEFYFTLPIENKNFRHKEKELKKEIEEQAQNLKILLAEDNTMNRKLLEMVLKIAGHNVLSAADGFELLKIFEENNDADLIVTDLQMPGMSGIEVVQILRNKTGKSKEIPIIALTAHAMQEDMLNALEAGCDAYLTKPIRPELILSKIQELIKK